MIKKIYRLFAIVLIFCFLFVEQNTVVPTFAEKTSGTVQVGGQAIGIRVKTGGVWVVSMEFGSVAQTAGIKIGDVIKKVDDKEIATSVEFENALKKSNKLEVLRDGQVSNFTVVPNLEKGKYRIGAWVKDEIDGIGILSFIDEQGNFAALGHPVAESTIEANAPLGQGAICEASISKIEKGVAGIPGQLRGNFGQNIGTISSNEDDGIFGEITTTLDGEKLEMADAVRGNAEIVTTVDGKNVERYKVEISKIDKNDKNNRNMVVKCEDDSLVAKTGGFVQGMSGSPIIQNGKLVGVLTHVFINTPLQGYGIFASNMKMSN